MSKLKGLKPERVFKYFEEICSIPHGSGDMEKISDYCMQFAKNHNLKAIKDEENNVIIFKDGSKGYENSEPIILQGHLDMVCQKTEGNPIDFTADGLDLMVDGDYVFANGTTLGGDNGIAVACVLAILESDEYLHPPIEAVFTTDEEIGMIGATALCTDSLRAKRMINLDSEEDDTVTVSCAGGSDFKASLKVKREIVRGKEAVITLSGLTGGHSGVEIDKGRVNASILMGRVLNDLKSVCDFEIVEIIGGDKCNAIPNKCSVKLVVNDENFDKKLIENLEIIKQEIKSREKDFCYSIDVCKQEKEHSAINSLAKEKLVYSLVCVPNGIVEMSKEIEGLVETSLNLGILNTSENAINFGFALRSNKLSALEYLKQRLFVFFSDSEFETSASGDYPPWEFVENSQMQEIYKTCFKAQFGVSPKVEALHAGLECGVFSAKIENLDCISIGPQIYDVHTTGEKLSISSTERIFNLVLKILEKCK